MCLHLFCGFLSLYIGCIFIGLTGMLIAILTFAISLFQLIDGYKNIIIVIFAMVFAFVYALSKMFLLFGTMWDLCWALLMSFLVGILGLGLLITVVLFLYIETESVLFILGGVILCIIELYYEWIIISTWWCCRSCTHDC
ncbi:uncharacterized protein LOC108096617 isoform X2 [Drosophila ficusphila]|uniref:uncharacterized protein LOC108096617 isoform X2 n=1 Tax=Drosophila ficusphila TaxID=30025 RepID=UPI0007E848FB|nr:uncharacterized protein LOC108096617 isoform X2 [Drosophila ficusphila]